MTSTSPAGPVGAPVTLTTVRGRRDVIAQVAGTVIGSQALAWFLIVLASMIGGTGSSEVPVGQIVLAVILLVVAGAADGITALLCDRSASQESARLHRLLLRHCFGLGPASFTGQQTGRVVAMLTDGVERVAAYRQSFLGSTIGSVLGPLLILVSVAVAIDPLSAGVLLLCIPFIPLAIGGFQRAFRTVSAASRAARQRLAAEFLTAIQGLPTLTLLGAAHRIGDRLASTGEANRRATMSLLARNQLILFVTDTAFSLFMVSAAAALAFWRLSQQAIDPGQALGLVLVSTLLCAPVDKVGGFFYIGMAGKAMQRQLLGLLRRPVPASTSSELSPTRGGVVAEDLRFGYDPERPVLDDVCLDVPEGTRAVVFGRSGSGKSTLIPLLCGDLVPQRGRCVVAGIPLSSETQDRVRAQSALMRQHTWLFYGSLAENLRIGSPDAPDEELWRSLDRVALGEWARRLPDGLDTPLGERGLAVSGGQAQRISLARAMLSGRGLLLLDEPTSQVDLTSERIIWKTIDELAATHTIVMASHRSTAARHTDQVLVMNDGRLEEGRADDLHR